MDNKNIADAKSITMAVAFILVFAIMLFFAISSLGRAEGDPKVAPGTRFARFGGRAPLTA